MQGAYGPKRVNLNLNFEFDLIPYSLNIKLINFKKCKFFDIEKKKHIGTAIVKNQLRSRSRTETFQLILFFIESTW